MANILITGGTGLIGRHLSRMLQHQGYKVAWLSRQSHQQAEFPTYGWSNPEGALDQEAIRFADVIIHLAGSNLSQGRWTKRRKQQILESRVQTALRLHRSIKESGKKLDAFFGSSAVGYYGQQPSPKTWCEEDPPGDDFLAGVCEQWEQVSEGFRTCSERVAIVRTGVVLANHGGAYPEIVSPILWGIGSILGSGEQFFPWIHIEDLCGIYCFLLKKSNLDGSFNAVAPEVVTNRILTETLSRIYHRPLWLPSIPAFLLEMALGEMSTLVLKGNRISAEKIQRAGYDFLYPKLQDACLALKNQR